MEKNPDHWMEGYRAALNGANYADNPHEGKPGADAWAFGCGQGMRDRNMNSIHNLAKRLPR